MQAQAGTYSPQPHAATCRQARTRGVDHHACDGASLRQEGAQEGQNVDSPQVLPVQVNSSQAGCGIGQHGDLRVWGREISAGGGR